MILFLSRGSIILIGSLLFSLSHLNNYVPQGFTISGPFSRIEYNDFLLYLNQFIYPISSLCRQIFCVRSTYTWQGAFVF